jgi:hypothetical protein
MAPPSTTYAPRCPDAEVLYQVVRDHLETFLAQAASLRDGDGVPPFVEHAFRQFLRCGWLAGGFARFRCAGCGLDRLVAFSCKGRGLCPSCGGRRMAEGAAHLVDRVLPDVPIRHWVLSLPYHLRYLLAWDHDLCRAVAARLVRAVFRVLGERARDEGIDRGRGGAVVVIQRFGGALNLNVHVHALVLDGVFAPADDGTPVFHRIRRLTTLDVREVLATVEPLVVRHLASGGLLPDEAEGGTQDPWVDEAPVLAGLAAASVQGRLGIGARPGARPGRLGVAASGGAWPSAGPCQADANGFSLHARLVIPAGQRGRLEQVCRYLLRPPVAGERLRVTAKGHVCLSLAHPWRDGTTAFVFDPVAFLARLAVLVPRPRVNLVLYYGVLGARAAWRAGVVPGAPAERGDSGEASDPERCPRQDGAEDPGRAMSWAALMARTFGLDVLACPRCGGRLRLVALIDHAAVVARILRHLGLPTEIPPACPARAPPLLSDPPTDADWEGDPSVFAPCC